MKKIITLLLAAGAFVTVNAQTSKEEARKVILGGSKNGGTTTTSKTGRDVILGGGNNGSSDYPNYPGNYPSSQQAQVDQINREYDAKTYSIRTNNTLSQAEKERIIRELEKQRAKEIKQVNKNYGGNTNNNDDNCNGKTKKNNGKKLGWEKGKGNPHNSKATGKSKNKKG